MKKLLAVICGCLILTGPAMANRDNGNGQNYEGLPTNVDLCTKKPEACMGGTHTHASKHSDAAKIVVISVAAGVVFAGAMYYIFKKRPSDNKPGQVKLAEF